MKSNSRLKYEHSESVHNTQASEILVPYILSLLDPKSVLDVGCGIGTWLHVFRNYGVKDVFGIDGGYIDKSLLSKYLPPDCFQDVDLECSFDLGRKFDMVLSLEVAEHLSINAAREYVSSLCLHADIVVFSAAVPGQDGQNHLNEQWPKYWIDIFNSHGFEVFDPFRRIFWNDSRIDPWYRQNLFLFSRLNLNLDKPFISDIILPDYWGQKTKKLARLKDNLERIRDGKVGFFFYLKGLFKSLKYLGRKVR